jgi:hypothetical protein
VESPFDLGASIERARLRLGDTPTGRKRRSDRGQHRSDPRVIQALRRLLGGHDYPTIGAVLEELRAVCARRSLPCPSRATLYKLILAESGPRYPVASLPEAVRAALYNLDLQSSVPGAQLAFYCFNYGELPALCFAAGLPWLALYQAWRSRGWHEKSRGLLRAVLVARGIPVA